MKTQIKNLAKSTLILAIIGLSSMAMDSAENKEDLRATQLRNEANTFSDNHMYDVCAIKYCALIREGNFTYNDQIELINSSIRYLMTAPRLLLLPEDDVDLIIDTCKSVLAKKDESSEPDCAYITALLDTLVFDIKRK